MAMLNFLFQLHVQLIYMCKFIVSERDAFFGLGKNMIGISKSLLSLKERLLSFG